MRLPSAGIVAAVASLVVMAGCGDVDYPVRGDSFARASDMFCEPAEASSSPTRQSGTDPVELDPGAQIQFDATIEVRLIEFRTLGVIPQPEDENTFFYPASGNRFVAVVYTMRNLGPTPVEAANTVNDLMVLGSEDRTWRQSSDSCAAAAAGLATSLEETSPEAELDEGDSYATVAVYVVDEDQETFNWVAPGSAD